MSPSRSDCMKHSLMWFTSLLAFLNEKLSQILLSKGGGPALQPNYILPGTMAPAVPKWLPLDTVGSRTPPEVSSRCLPWVDCSWPQRISSALLPLLSGCRIKKTLIGLPGQGGRLGYGSRGCIVPTPPPELNSPLSRVLPPPCLPPPVYFMLKKFNYCKAVTLENKSISIHNAQEWISCIGEIRRVIYTASFCSTLFLDQTGTVS